MKKIISIITIFLIFSTVYAEFEFVETSVVNMALSGSGIAYIKDVSVLTSNPAAIAHLDKGQFYAVSMEEFSIDEMQSNFISLGNKMSNYFNFAFSNLDFGYFDYK
jgi:long-subunit fatty acid transport protein